MPQAEKKVQIEAIKALNKCGWTDVRISKGLGLSITTLRNWRRDNGIPTLETCGRIDTATAMEMHSRGCTDRDIASSFGVDPSAVCKWRTRRNLPSNADNGILTEGQVRVARKLLRRGYKSTAVAAEVGCCKGTIIRVRSGMKRDGLRGTGINDWSIRRAVLNDRTIWKRLEDAIGMSVPDDIRADAVHAMYADLLDGKLAIDQIEKRAPSYRSQAYDMCGSRFGPISLDAENDDGNTLADILSEDMLDPAWLE